MKKFLAALFWLFSLIIVSIYTYENPERFDVIKHNFKKYTTPKIKVEKGPTQIIKSNSFNVELSKVVSLNNKTAFIIHEKNISNFSENNLIIYTQNGYLLKNSKSEKLNLPDFFTTKKNGGIKTIFVHEDSQFALISSFKEKCFYASIILLNNSKEVLKTKCLPDERIDYNGLGSSSIHYDNKIIISIGAPEQVSHKIAQLAQEDKSFFGKIIEIEKSDLNKVVENEKNNLIPKIFTKGNRNPQGLTKIGNSIFSVEHGPRGGDELNKIIKNKNYGWPIVSYGAKYSYDQK